MRAKTPYFGPHAGVLLIDGVPAAEGPTPCIHPVAVPDEFGSPVDPGKTRRGIDRTAKVLHDQYQRSGSDRTYSDAQDRVRAARTRLDNSRG